MLTDKPEGEARAALLDRAAAFEAALALCDATPEADAAPAVSPADIWRAARVGDAASLTRVLAAARAAPSVGAAFARALDRGAPATFRPLRAAAAGAIARRLDGGHGLELRRSAQRPGRCFLVVSVPTGAPVPTQLVYLRGETLGALALGPLAEGVIQMALDAADPAIAAIEDRAATLYLR